MLCRNVYFTEFNPRPFPSFIKFHREIGKRWGGWKGKDKIQSCRKDRDLINFFFRVREENAIPISLATVAD